MAGTLVKKVMLKITADDGDAETKLALISAKSDELAAKHPELKVRIDTAAASAKVRVLRSELKAAGDEAEKPHKFSLSGIVPAIGEMGMFQKVMLAVNVATTVAEPLLAGVVVATGGIAAGALAAGAGLGVFGLVAKSVWSQASAGATAYAAAQKKLDLATTSAQRTSALRAEKAALMGLSPPVRGLAVDIGHVENQWKRFTNAAAPGVVGVISQGLGLLPKVFAAMKPFLAPVERSLHGIIGELSHGLGSSGFASFIHMLAGNAGPALTKLAGIVGHIAVGLGGLARAFMPEAQKMLGGLDKITGKFAIWGQTLTKHSGFKSLMQMFKTETPLAVKVLTNLGGILKTVGSDMTGLSGVGNSKTLLQLAVPFTHLLNVLLKANPDLVRFGLYALAASSSIKKVAPAFSGVKTGIDVVKGGVSAFRDLHSGLTSAESAASAATGVWGTIGGKISTATTAIKDWGIGSKIAAAATKVWTGVQAAFDIVMDANPIALIVIGIVALIAIIVICVIKFKGFREFWIGLWKDVVHLFGMAVDWVKTHWKLLPAIFLGPLGIVITIVLTHFNQIKALGKTLIHDVFAILGWFGKLPGLFKGWWDEATNAQYKAVMAMVHFVTSIPGKILAALGNVGKLLWNAGTKIIDGLVGGITSKIGSVTHAISGIAGEITSHLPFSPAKKGPLSGAGDPFISGQKITTRLAAGMQVGGPMVHAAARKVAAAAGAVGGTPTSAGAGGGAQRIELVFAGGGEGRLGRAVWTWFKEEVRVKGGGGPNSAQRALGHA